MATALDMANAFKRTPGMVALDLTDENKVRTDTLGSLKTTYGISDSAIEMARSGDYTFMEEELLAKGLDPVAASGIARQASESLSASTDVEGNKAAINLSALLKKYAPTTTSATGTPTYTVPASEQKTKEEKLAQAMTARQMSLLQQAMNSQRQQGVSSLRGNLAQRGVMDSGSLGAGIGRINRDIGQQTAQGALMAANQEGSTLLDFLRQQKQNQANQRQAWQQRQWGLQDRSWQERMNSDNRNWEQKQRNKDREAQLWGGLLGGAGGALGGWASGGFRMPSWGGGGGGWSNSNAVA